MHLSKLNLIILFLLQNAPKHQYSFQHQYSPLMAPPWVQQLHIPHIDIPIIIDQMVPILPAAPTPAADGHSLYLSNLDDVIGARVFTPTVYFYPFSGKNSREKSVVMDVLSEALSLVLVPYYPFSGRLRETHNGKLEVFFGPEQGALMVEAHSEMTLSSLGDITIPNPSWEPLIFKFPNEEPYKILQMPLLIAQITLFKCGGFSLGLRLCHCICDGLGAMQFLTAWAATARSKTLTTNPIPCWDREFFKPREPPAPKFPHLEFMKIDDGSTLTATLWDSNPVQRCYRVSREFQLWVKSNAQGDVSSGCCSTFDAMSAHVWRSWVKALDVKPVDYTLRLTFSVNARSKLENPQLKSGFYGNVLCLPCVTSTVSELVDGGLSGTTRLVRAARNDVSEEYVKSTVDYIEVDRPRRLEFGGKLTITQWTRFSIYESADFGWGRPVYAGPIDLSPTPQVCVFLPDGAAETNGSMMVCICLPESCTEKFMEFLCRMD